MSVTLETSHEEMSPLKEVAWANIPDMPITPERSGTSVARYTMFAATLNAEFIDSIGCRPTDL